MSRAAGAGGLDSRQGGGKQYESPTLARLGSAWQLRLLAQIGERGSHRISVSINEAMLCGRQFSGATQATFWSPPLVSCWAQHTVEGAPLAAQSAALVHGNGTAGVAHAAGALHS